jgi:16S rRNA (guanine527-N7)-methyltransferase
VNPAEVEERLERFSRLLLARNAGLNLTSARDAETIAGHVRDSLSLLPYLAEPFVDVGSGGGFPALVLVIATGYRATLVESVLKKARFLQEVVADLGLPVEVRGERAEDAARDPGLREHFAAATARAVASAPAVIELTLPFLALGGVALLQRGRLDPHERAAAADAALVLGGRLDGEVAAAPPPSERRILMVRKIAPTPQRFPRRAGVPAKRPLCARPGEVVSDD